MTLLAKLKTKLAGEEANPSSPDQALTALSTLPDHEKEKVLDYLQSAMQLQQHEPQ